jgi:hypothetical protein
MKKMIIYNYNMDLIILNIKKNERNHIVIIS